MQAHFGYFRLDVTSDHVIFALGPIGFISLNTRRDYSYPWGSFVAWVDLPGGSLEMNLDSSIEERWIAGSNAEPLFSYYPYE